MIRSIMNTLSAIGLVVLLVVMTNILWLKKHNQPVTLENVMVMDHAVSRSQELWSDYTTRLFSDPPSESGR
jgi:hypothetical protein